eukprot:scaffold28590_cov18-Tisochrysis_lutea.AAC.2
MHHSACNGKHCVFSGQTAGELHEWLVSATMCAHAAGGNGIGVFQVQFAAKAPRIAASANPAFFLLHQCTRISWSRHKVLWEGHLEDCGRAARRGGQAKNESLLNVVDGRAMRTVKVLSLHITNGNGQEPRRACARRKVVSNMPKYKDHCHHSLDLRIFSP